MIITDVRTNPKIGTLLPWLVCFIRNGMQRHCENKTLMFRLLSLLQAVFSNSTLNLSPKPYVSVFHIFIRVRNIKMKIVERANLCELSTVSNYDSLLGHIIGSDGVLLNLIEDI